MNQKKKRYFCLLYGIFFLLPIFVFSACEDSKIEEATTHRIYYINNTDTKLVSEGYNANKESVNELVEELLLCLHRTPLDPFSRPVLSDIVDVSDCLLEGNQLTLYFGEGYLTLTGVSEILTRAAIVKTLSQIPQIEHVSFYVNGQPLMKSFDQPVGWMEASDFLDNTGAESYFSLTTYLSIYYANEAGNQLRLAHIKLDYTGDKPQEQLVLEQLMKGPSEEFEDMYPTLPDTVKINQVATKDGICYLDLSADFLNKLPTVSEQVAVYSIVNSLVELNNISQVKITVDGEEKKLFLSLPMNNLLERKLELVEDS